MSQRWAKVCQDCWQSKNPNQYAPELTDWATCYNCGQDALVLSAHPADWPRKENDLKSTIAVEFIITHQKDLLSPGNEATSVQHIAEEIGIAAGKLWTKQPNADCFVTVNQPIAVGTRVLSQFIEQAPLPDPVALALAPLLGTVKVLTFAMVTVDGVGYLLTNAIDHKGWAVRRNADLNTPLGYIRPNASPATAWYADPTVGSVLRGAKRADEALRYLVVTAAAFANLGKTLTVSVTQADINNAIDAINGGGIRPEVCVIAQALNRAAPQPGGRWTVGGSSATAPDGKVYDLPMEAKRQIAAFDIRRYSEVRPDTFVLTPKVKA